VFHGVIFLRYGPVPSAARAVPSPSLLTSPDAARIARLACTSLRQRCPHRRKRGVRMQLRAPVECNKDASASRAARFLSLISCFEAGPIVTNRRMRTSRDERLRAGHSGLVRFARLPVLPNGISVAQRTLARLRFAKALSRNVRSL
jgi:hypothetical protein